MELMNAQTWLAGKHATLQLAVRHEGRRHRIAGAHITARIEGAAEPSNFPRETAQRPSPAGI